MRYGVFFARQFLLKVIRQEMSFYTRKVCALFCESHDSLSEHVESVLIF